MGQQQTKYFYNKAYSKGGHNGQYHKDAIDTAYYQMWQSVVDIIPFNLQVLELGCGAGHLASMIYASGKSYLMGVDFSEVAISMAKARNPKLIFLEKDIFNPALYSLPYEAMVICETLEHVENDCALFEMIPNGKLVVFSVPSFDSAGHVRYFNDISNVLDRYGKYLRNIQVKIFEVKPGQCIYLLAGYKTN